MPSPGKSRAALVRRINERLNDASDDRFANRKMTTLLNDILAYFHRNPPMGVEAAGAKGGAIIAARGPEFYRAIGRKGGKATLKKHGKTHFKAVGAVGGKAARTVPGKSKDDK